MSKKMSENGCASITWSIKNFSHYWQKINEAIVSPTFSVYMPEETKWKLMYFPSGICVEDTAAFFLYRDKDGNGVENIVLEYKLEILAADGSILASASLTNAFRNDTRQGFKRYIFRETITTEATKYLPQDILTLRCRMTPFRGKTLEIRQTYARTTIGVEKRCFLWPIQNFSNLTPNQKQTFAIQSSSENVMIQIDFYASQDHNDENKICFDICSFDQSAKSAVVKTFIIDSQKQKVDAGEYECCFLYGKCTTFPLKPTKKQLMDNECLYLPNDSLTLSFELTIRFAFEGVEKVSVLTENWRKCIAQEKIFDSPHALIADLESLYKDQSACDMKLQTKTDTFPVHSLILSARSPVFKRMFSSEMKEKINGCVDISDLNDKTVRRFLLYLYTDQLEDLKWEDAVQLYRTADKYAVISLKEKCSTFLKSILNLENVLEALILSDLHQDKDLKLSAQNLILRNARIIFKSEEWKILADTNSNLVIETMLRNWTEE